GFAVTGDAEQSLGQHVGPDRDDESTTDCELRDQRLRYFGTPCRDRDGIVRRMLRPPERSVAEEHVHVVEAESLESRGRRGGELLDALDGVDLRRDAAEHRCGVPGPGSNLE